MNLVRMEYEFNHCTAHFSLPNEGHGILVAAQGIWYSLTHKGTSYPWQVIRPDAPRAPAGNSRLDIMYYYKKPQPSNFESRRYLAEPDAQVDF